MASYIAFGALATVLPTQRKHITTMTTPVGADVSERFKPMRNAMVDLFFVSFLSKRSVLDDRERM